MSNKINDVFDGIQNRYITKGIAETVPGEIIVFIWEMIESMETRPRDYLQIFRFTRIGEGVALTQEQEQPEYKNTVMLLGNFDIPAGITVYVIADESNATMLLSEEY